ncbi:hypothetical protein GWK47_044081 [Chionoecetes opilio]|uniref:Uncharacterized protein n=1 Tax=Chionoecetes opilio TaxID=41210 RepID=A0A8J4Y745_CHIOP|nr:hypothetical protein GWK47_044081 [Chionoecetes opilio]
MKTVEADVLNSWSILSQVADGTYALLDTHSSAVGRAQQYEQQGENCKFHLSRHLVRLDLDAFAFARNSFLIHQFDLIMRRLRYAGIITHMQEHHYRLRCQTTRTTSGPQAMSLMQVVDHGGARPKERKVNNDHVVCTNSLQVLSGLQEEDKEGKITIKRLLHWANFPRIFSQTSITAGVVLISGDFEGIRDLPMLREISPKGQSSPALSENRDLERDVSHHCCCGNALVKTTIRRSRERKASVIGELR